MQVKGSIEYDGDRIVIVHGLKIQSSRGGGYEDFYGYRLENGDLIVSGQFFGINYPMCLRSAL